MNRRFRLLTALGVVMVLTTFMLYTALAGQDVREPVLQASELAAKRQLAATRDVQVDGVAAGPVKKSGRTMTFYITGKKGGGEKTLVRYSGSVPDAFRVGRHVIVTGQLESAKPGADFVAQRDSLVTKCPSKFESDGGSSRSSS